MDAADFVMRFDAEKAGLINVVREGLLQGGGERSGIENELYKLNVYGKALWTMLRSQSALILENPGRGSFFKPHRDTPHSQQMFGSLVIVFPTPHEGGALVLRHAGEEWVFDAAKLLSGHSDRIAYIAFFSDVEHEVLPVLSGHRVTVTYNLRFTSRETETALPQGLNIIHPDNVISWSVKRALRAFLRCPTVLPQGGTLGFGLRHYYALPKTVGLEDGSPLRAIGAALKGSDAALFSACEELGLTPYLRLVTNDFMSPVIFRRIGWEVIDDGGMERALLRENNGKIVEDVQFDHRKDDDTDYREDDDTDFCDYRRLHKLPIHWVTEMNDENQTSQPYAMYGNEVSLGFIYVSVCLIAEVDEYEKRIEDFGDEEDSELEEEEIVPDDSDSERQSVEELGQ
ncbi:hypothetical protein C8Q77DRAFT_1146288 [Trametes polyzona]|nr:hypothetical protein C8Q77DRAFT_1146288 [Trametes polyzona]